MFDKTKVTAIFARVKTLASKVPIITVEVVTVQETDSEITCEVKSGVNFTISAILTLALILTIINCMVAVWPLLAFYAIIKIGGRIDRAIHKMRANRKSEVNLEEVVPA